MLGQCSVLCRESPKGVSTCGKLLVKCRIMAVKESGEGTCIGSSRNPVSLVIMGETCIGWFAFVSHSECNLVKRKSES